MLDEERKLSQAELSRATFYGLICGSTSLIPIPFLDDWILNLLRRYMARDLLGQGHITLSFGQARSLTRLPSRWVDGGCLSAAGYGLVVMPLTVIWYVIKKIFRKLVIVFMLKEATDRAVLSFHEAYLLVLAGHRKSSRPMVLEGDRLAALRQALFDTLGETDTTVLSHVFKGIIRLNRKTLSQAGRQSVKTWRRLRRKSGPEVRAEATEAMHQEELLLEGVGRQASEKILVETGHLEDLEERFEAKARYFRFLDGEVSGYEPVSIPDADSAN